MCSVRENWSVMLSEFKLDAALSVPQRERYSVYNSFTKEKQLIPTSDF